MARTGMGKGRPPSMQLQAQTQFHSEAAPVEPPGGLNEIGKAFWCTVFAAAKWLDPRLDALIVLHAALLVQDMDEVRAEINRSGRYQTIPNGSRVRSAAVVDHEKLQIQLNTYLAALGLTPADRNRLGVHIYSEDDPLVQLEIRREQRARERTEGPPALE